MTLTRNAKGNYVPFVSRALNSKALAQALAGKPLHARMRQMMRSALGHSTALADQGRHVANATAKRRRLNKAAGHPTYTRTGAWSRTKRAMSGRSWRH